MSSYSYVPFGNTGLASSRNEPGTFLAQHPLERLPIKTYNNTRKATPDTTTSNVARGVLAGAAVQFCGDTAFTGGAGGVGNDGMRTSLPNAGPEGERRFTPSKRTREANRFFGEQSLGKKSVTNCQSTGVSRPPFA